MTLQEYLNQAKPVRYNKVILKKDEYVEHQTIKADGVLYTSIEMPTLNERFKEHGGYFIYVRINKDKQLWTKDSESGKPKSRSVFYLPYDVKDLPDDMKLYKDFLNEKIDFLDNWMKNNPYNLEETKRHNESFTIAYTEFLNSVKEKYNLAEDTIKSCLKFD